MAQEGSKSSAASDEGLIIRSLEAVASVRDDWSARWVDFTEDVDRFLSNEELAVRQVNGSYLKLQIQESFLRGGEIESDVRLRAKVDLPNTERRTKLFFSSDPDRDEDLAGRASSVSSGERLRRQGSVTGLEFAPDSFWHKWKRSYRVGMKFHLPVVPYVRARFQRQFSDWSGWSREFNQELSYFHDQGWGEISELRLNRQIRPGLSLNYLTSVEFEDQRDYFENLQLLVVSHRMSDRDTLDFRLGGIYTSEERGRAERYFTAYNYSRRLHEDWVFITMTPEVSFSRIDRWRPEPSFTLRFDVYFSE